MSRKRTTYSAVFGTADEMNNVKLNENPIMEALGEETRMSYNGEI